MSEGMLDPLTGLPSRALLMDRLEQAVFRSARSCSTCGAMMILLRIQKSFLGLCEGIGGRWENGLAL